MAPITTLAPQEPARLDIETLSDLYGDMGPSAAEEAVCRAMEELALRLAESERAFRADDWTGVNTALRRVIAISRQIGMVGLVRVARDSRACLEMGDSVALAATIARLLRNGERSLLALWDRQDLTL
ncbi:hypothetical protein [Roseivivax sp. CAU 1753]